MIMACTVVDKNYWSDLVSLYLDSKGLGPMGGGAYTPASFEIFWL